jgi:ribosomal protein S18 acetylase RimI-like enzyme
MLLDIILHASAPPPADAGSYSFGRHVFRVLLLQTTEARDGRINWTAVGALATAVSALVAAAALFFIYRQISTTRRIAACEFILRLSNEYHSPILGNHRSRLAKALLQDQRLWSAKEEPPDEESLQQLKRYAIPVTGYFERIGMMFRNGLLPTYFVWTTHYVRVDRYYLLLQNLVRWARMDDPTYLVDFEYLYRELSSYHRRKLAPRDKIGWLPLMKLRRHRAPAESPTDERRLRAFLVSQLQVHVQAFEESDVQHTLISPALRDKLLQYNREGAYVAVAQMLERGEPDCEYLGYVVARIRDGRGETEPMGQIVEIVVDSRFRNLGIGERLCSHVCQQMRQWNIKHCYTELRTDSRMIRFFEKVGFTRGEPLKNHFPRGIAAYRMVLPLRE